MKVYYVRHAEPNYDNHNDAQRELSPGGMEKRKLVTKYLSDKHIDTALSSPYRRAIDTIKDFTDGAGLKIEIEEDFRERKIGEWIENFDAYAVKQWADFSYKLPGGECLWEVQGRNIRALSMALGRYRGKNIIIGGHGTALCTIINYYDPSFGYDNFQRCKGKMPWIVEMEFDDENLQLHSIQWHDLY